LNFAHENDTEQEVVSTRTGTVNLIIVPCLSKVWGCAKKSRFHLEERQYLGLSLD